MVFGFAATALLLGCSSQKKEEPVVTVQAATAHRAAISQIITNQALLYPLQEAAITPKIGAPVEKFYVNRGAVVRAGQLLVTLQNQDLQAAAVENQGAYQQAQAEYQQATSANVPQEVQKAQVDLQTAKQALDAQQKVYTARENLFNQGAIPRKELDDARVTLVESQGAYQIALKHWQALQAGGTQQALKSAKGQFTSAKGKYLAAQAQLGYSEIRSPINGVVTDRLSYPGQMADANTPVVTVMDLSQVIAKAHIPADQAALLKPGDPALITAAGADSPVPGKVSIVSPALDPGSTTVEVWVQAKNPLASSATSGDSAPQQSKSSKPRASRSHSGAPNYLLRPGVSVQVQMTAKTVPDALVVPVAAVLQDDSGKTQVMVIGSDQVATAQDVQTGIQQGDQVQIVSGLQPGQQVVTAGAYGLPDKTKVNVQSSNASNDGSAAPQD